MSLHDTNSLFSCELFFSLLDVYSWPCSTTTFFTCLLSYLSASLQCSVSLDRFVLLSSLFHLFPSLSFLLYFFEMKHYRLLTCMFISLHYMVPHRVGSIASIVSRVCMDTLLLLLSCRLCLLQRLRSLTHFSNGCSRVSRRLFRDKEACAVYMDETKPIYHVDDNAFLLSDFEFRPKKSDRSNKRAWGNRIILNTLYRVCLFFLSIASG